MASSGALSVYRVGQVIVGRVGFSAWEVARHEADVSKLCMAKRRCRHSGLTVSVRINWQRHRRWHSGSSHYDRKIDDGGR